MKSITGDGSTKAAIMHLQAAMRARFNKQTGKSCGGCTLFITPNAVDLTNEQHAIIGSGPVRVAQALGRKGVK